MSILLGLRDDAQTQAMAKHCTHVHYWEDFLDSWWLTHSSRAGFQLHTRHEQPLTLKQTELLVRGPGGRALSGSAATLVSMLTHFQSHYPRPGASPLNKATPLGLFGSLAPRTRIVQNRDFALHDADQWVCKSLSNVRSKVACVAELEQKGNGLPTLPTMIQARAQGQEYKLTVFAIGSRRDYLNLAIEANAVDYRYARTPATFRSVDRIPSKVRAAVERIISDTGAGFFDLDYFVGEDGSVQVLEWNNSPATASTEADLGSSFSMNLVSQCKTVVLTSRVDSVARDMLSYDERMAEVLFLEDLGRTWSFSFARGQLRFETQRGRLWPKKTYLRPVRLDLSKSRDRSIHSLMLALELEPNSVVSPNSRQFRNGSKILQTVTSLKEAKERVPNARVILPRSYIIKGPQASLEKLLNRIPRTIVKSLSGVRSRVVDQSAFSRFDGRQLSSLPTLFQECHIGADVRVHVFGGCAHGKIVNEKDAIDYRYAEKRSGFEDYLIDADLKRYCEAVSDAEKNAFVGLDFLKCEDGYVCLEANPSPGWSWYYPSKERHDFYSNFRDFLHDRHIA